MATNLTVVFERAKEDVDFCKDLFANGSKACSKVGLELAKDEAQKLDNAMSEARRYFSERLYLLSQVAQSRFLGLKNWYCVINCR